MTVARKAKCLIFQRINGGHGGPLKGREILATVKGGPGIFPLSPSAEGLRGTP